MAQKSNLQVIIELVDVLEKRMPVGESLFTFFASLTYLYAHHYLIKLIK